MRWRFGRPSTRPRASWLKSSANFPSSPSAYSRPRRAGRSAGLMIGPACASRLNQSLLAEEVDFGSEGGIYRSPFGTWTIDESGRELTLKLNSSQSADAPTADAISRFLVSMAAPGSANFRADFASLLASVSLLPDNSLTLHLKRAYVRPEALLQVALPDSSGQVGTYSIAGYEPNQIVFSRQDEAARPSAPRAVVEQTMPTDEAAVAALLAGEVDVLDRVPPWQLERLRARQACISRITNSPPSTC